MSSVPAEHHAARLRAIACTAATCADYTGGLRRAAAACASSTDRWNGPAPSSQGVGHGSGSACVDDSARSRGGICTCDVTTASVHVCPASIR